MAKETTFGIELKDLENYLKSKENEDAKRQLLFPLFKKLFKEKFVTESAAAGADIYIEGQVIVECKTDFSQWLEGFYQALHYQRKNGLAFNSVMVIAHNFCAIWKLKKLPEFAVVLSRTADVIKAPNTVGKENAKKTAIKERNEIKDAAFYWIDPKNFENTFFSGGKSHTIESFEILKILKNLDSDRLQVNKHNFIQVIERMKGFFDHAIDAVHAFYSIIPYWDITSTVAGNEHDELRLIGYSGTKFSDNITVAHSHIRDFKKFIETQYIFTNEGSGLTVDYYFSRFDEVLAIIDPEYVKQHGIFFTDANLSRYALWFAKHHFPGNINEDYIVFDPAGGSGNLVSSWRGKLKHKIVSELQPDLLRIIERRMKADPFHIDTGFTIIPRTSENTGLNFLDRSATDYMAQLSKELNHKNVKLDKPLAFLLNPPYKNTDENVKAREEKEAHYGIDQTILDITGEDAGKERYLGFLGQILNICKWQTEENSSQVTQAHGNSKQVTPSPLVEKGPGVEAMKPVVMIFTPTSWLIPRPTYVPFRKKWDAHFRYHSGFIVTSNEFFKLEGKWPLAFTIWIYDDSDAERENKVEVFDLSGLKKVDLNEISWGANDDTVDREADKITAKKKPVLLDNSRGDLKANLNLVERRGELIKQPRLNIYRNRTKDEQGKLIVSGFPLKDERHERTSVPYGYTDGNYIGFMDDLTPVRLRQEPSNRLSNLPDRVWFYLDNRMQKINLLKCMPGTPDKYGYAANDLESAKITFSWFCIGKVLVGHYPLWANMYDLWTPNIKLKRAKYWYSLCFAFVLAENRCVVTKFEANNPVQGAPEVFVNNPMCPTQKESFWATTLDKEIVTEPNTAINLVLAVKNLYHYWNMNYCKGQYLYNVGLKNEPYFKYFDYPDFLTPHSGLIQIRKYAEQEGHTDLLELFSDIAKATKEVKAELYRLLVDEFKYFD